MTLNKTLFNEQNFTSGLVQAVGNRLYNEEYGDAIKQAFLYLTKIIRERSNLTEDGVPLVSKAFKQEDGDSILKINNLHTETEKGEQRGVMFLGQGVYSAFRNPLNHSIHTTLTEKDCIRQLIIIDMMLDYANKEIIETNTVAKVLFESVTTENKEYYHKRDIDNTVNQILQLKNIWIHGESGIGKTNIAQYYFLNNSSFYHSIYFTTTEDSVENYLSVIFEDLVDKIGNENIDINEGLRINRKLSKILCYLSQNNNKVTIHLDELSDLGDAMFQNFFISLIDILTNVRDNCNLTNVNFIITTLFDPNQYVNNIQNLSHRNKINTQFDFIRLEKWSNNEMTSLINFITDKLNITTDMLNQLDSLNGNPRELKNRMRTEINNT